MFSRSYFMEANEELLYLAFKPRGYNNDCSGESFFIKKVLSPSNPILCIDIGANIGIYTSELLEYTDSRVVSFEPLPSAFQKLSEATKEFKHRVTLENKGIGKDTGNLTIHFNPSALQIASFAEEVKKISFVTNEQKVTCPVVSLDSYCQEKGIAVIDLVKIDVEGFELEVFEGATNTFSKIKPRFIQMEFNWHQLFRNTSLNVFAERLPEYDLYQLIPNGWAKRDPRDPLTNIYWFSNFVFVRKA